MSFKCGIVGLPNVGKSTLFNVLTQKSRAAASNYPFCTIDPNEGRVPVPDDRLEKIASIVNPQNIIPTFVEFVDIAGLVAGASKGEGLGNQFLAYIRETQAIVHVVRCFEDEAVVHVAGVVSPEADVAVINIELMLADMQTVEKHLIKLAKDHQARADKQAQQLYGLFEKLRAGLNNEILIRQMILTDAERELLQPYQFLTAKPLFYIANVAEDGFDNNVYLDKLRVLAEKEGAAVVVVCAAIESELITLSVADRKAWLKSLGFSAPGLDRVIQVGYELLGLITFFTAGPKEVRAWTCPVGATAPEAAGVIHSDFEKKFIRAEVISYDDYLRCSGEQGAKSAGKWRLEGKAYTVEDGDVMHFRSG